MFYPLSSTLLINSIKHEHLCKILYVSTNFDRNNTIRTIGVHHLVFTLFIRLQLHMPNDDIEMI